MSQPPPPGASIVDHWTPLPGFGADRTLLACYLTLDGRPAVRAAVAAHQRAIAGVESLDPISPEWLHTTVQGIGFVDTLGEGCGDRLAARLRPVLAEVPALRVTLGEPEPGASCVLMPLSPTDALAAIRTAVRDVARRTFGVADLYTLPGQGSTFAPHLSIAYASGDVPADAVRARLATVSAGAVALDVDAVSLVELRRRDRAWQWTREIRIPLAAGPARRPVVPRQPGRHKRRSPDPVAG